MRSFNVVNYHLTNHCNYRCLYCFGKFNSQIEPSFEDGKQIIDGIASYFLRSEVSNGRINFAGGEPTLYPYLDDLINYASSVGVSVSLVTNGSLLNIERIRSWKEKVSGIGISVDSTAHDTNCLIGRCSSRKTLDRSNLIEIAKEMGKSNIDLKINTVVSRLNLKEDFSSLYRDLSPKRIKFFQMHLVDGINDRAKPYAITKEEFESFCDKHREFRSIIVKEPCGSMENSYLMINPSGQLQVNDCGVYQTFGDLKTDSLFELMDKVPLDGEKFLSRYKKEC